MSDQEEERILEKLERVHDDIAANKSTMERSMASLNIDLTNLSGRVSVVEEWKGTTEKSVDRIIDKLEVVDGNVAANSVKLAKWAGLGAAAFVAIEMAMKLL